MHKLLLELPERLETERLYLRPYRAGDGAWYYSPMELIRDRLSHAPII